jgi:hypothetical protein
MPLKNNGIKESLLQLISCADKFLLYFVYEIYV